MGNNSGQVFGLYACNDESILSDLDHLSDRPLENRGTVLNQRWPTRLAIAQFEK